MYSGEENKDYTVTRMMRGIVRASKYRLRELEEAYLACKELCS